MDFFAMVDRNDMPTWNIPWVFADDHEKRVSK